MKAIKVNTIITSLSSRQDGSLRLSCVTPELSKDEKANFMELQGLNLDALFEPLDFKPEGVYKVDKEAGEKTPSKRLRDRMWVYYSKKFPGEKNFDAWRARELDRVGRVYLDKLD